MQNRVANGMAQRTVKVDRDKLLERLRANLAAHLEEYEAARAGYFVAAACVLAEKREEFRRAVEEADRRLGEGKFLPPGLPFSPHYLGLTPPECHESDYRHIIEMVAMSVDPVIELRSDEFDCYVMDNWEWTREFKAFPANFAAMAVDKDGKA